MSDQPDAVPDRVLWVDDDADVLRLVARLLEGFYELDTAPDAIAGLAMLAKGTPYIAIVSDMGLPGMNGLALLGRVRQLHPDTVRIMVTGDGSQKLVTDALNQGEIFRVLTKPMSRALLVGALNAASVRYHVTIAERELFSDTLTSVVQLLIDILVKFQPASFERANRVRTNARAIAQRLRFANPWEVELAALLAHVGCVDIQHGGSPAAGERTAHEDHPQVGGRLLANIPRLRAVAEAVALQNTPFPAMPKISADAERLPPSAASILRVALSFDDLLFTGLTPSGALARMLGESGSYDPDVLEALAVSEADEAASRFLQLPIQSIAVGMVLAADITDDAGRVLLSAGQQITAAIDIELRNSGAKISPARLFLVLPTAA